MRIIIVNNDEVIEDLLGLEENQSIDNASVNYCNAVTDYWESRGLSCLSHEAYWTYWSVDKLNGYQFADLKCGAIVANDFPSMIEEDLREANYYAIDKLQREDVYTNELT